MEKFYDNCHKKCNKKRPDRKKGNKQPEIFDEKRVYKQFEKYGTKRTRKKIGNFE